MSDQAVVRVVGWVNCASMWGLLLPVASAITPEGERLIGVESLLTYCGIKALPSHVTALRLSGGELAVTELGATLTAMLSPLDGVREALAEALLAVPSSMHARLAPQGGSQPPNVSNKAARRLAVVHEEIVERKQMLHRGEHPALLLEFGASPPNGTSMTPSASMVALLIPCEASSGHDRDHSLEEAMALAKMIARDIRRCTVPFYPRGAWGIRSRIATYKWLRQLDAGTGKGGAMEKVLRLTLLLPTPQAKVPAWMRHSLAWWRQHEGAWMINHTSAPGVKRTRFTPPALELQEQEDERDDEDEDRRAGEFDERDQDTGDA